MDVLIFDLAALRYRWDPARTSLSMFSPLREQLALVHPPVGCDDREAATLACDQALELTRLRRPGVEADRSRRRFRVGLYNPFTAKVSIDAIPNTRVFGDLAPLEIPSAGLEGRLEGDGDDEVLNVGTRRLVLAAPSVAELTRELAANRL